MSWRRARERETRFSKTTWRGDGRKLRHDGPECPEVAHLAPPVRDLAHYLPRDFRPLLLARGRVPATYGPGKKVGGSRKKKSLAWAPKVPPRRNVTILVEARGLPLSLSLSLPLSLSLHERSGPGHLAPGQDGVSSHSPPRQADLALPVHQQDELNHLRSSSVSPQLPPPTSTTTRALSLPTSRTLNQRPPGLGNTFPGKVWEQKSFSRKSSKKRDRVPDGGGRGGGNRGLSSPPGARRGFDRIISWTWRASRFTFRCPAASAPRRVARGWAQLGHTPLFHWPRGGVLSGIGPRHGTAG